LSVSLSLPCLCHFLTLRAGCLPPALRGCLTILPPLNDWQVWRVSGFSCAVCCLTHRLTWGTGLSEAIKEQARQPNLCSALLYRGTHEQPAQMQIAGTLPTLQLKPGEGDAGVSAPPNEPNVNVSPEGVLLKFQSPQMSCKVAQP
jgi:hypothetical protein